MTGDELGGVRWDRTSKEQVEVVVDARRQNLLGDLFPSGLVVGEQRSDTMLVVINLKEFSQTRLTNVKTNENNLLSKQSETDSKVGCIERLTLTRRT